jgi:hypothetical protein
MNNMNIYDFCVYEHKPRGRQKFISFRRAQIFRPGKVPVTLQRRAFTRFSGSLFWTGSACRSREQSATIPGSCREALPIISQSSRTLSGQAD